MPTERIWKVAAAIPLALLAVSFALEAIEPDCGSAGSPPCESGGLEDLAAWTSVLGVVGVGLFVGALALRRIQMAVGRRRYRWVVLALALPWAYAAGWVGDAILNEDACIAYEPDDASPSATEWLNEKWPVRSNCRFVFPDGEGTFVRGDASVFYGVFGFWIVVAILLVIPGRWWLRLAGAVVAFVAAVAVMFGLV